MDCNRTRPPGQRTRPQDSASPHAASPWTFQTEPIPEAWTVIDARLGERVIVRSFEQLGGILSGRTRHAKALRKARQTRELYSGCGFTRERVMALVKISSSTFFRYLSTCWDHCRSGFRRRLVPRTTCNSNNNSNSTGHEDGSNNNNGNSHDHSNSNSNSHTPRGDESRVSAFMMMGWDGLLLGFRRFYRLKRHNGYIVDLKTVVDARKNWKCCVVCGLAGSRYPFCLEHALEMKSSCLHDDPPPVKVQTPEQGAKAIIEKYGPLPTDAEIQSEEHRKKYGFLRIPDRRGIPGAGKRNGQLLPIKSATRDTRKEIPNDYALSPPGPAKEIRNNSGVSRPRTRKEIPDNRILSQQPVTAQQVAGGRSLVDTIKWLHGGRRRRAPAPPAAPATFAAPR